MPSIKLVITSKNKLKAKYQAKFSQIEKLLAQLVKADKAKGLKTLIVYIDDADSAKKAGIKAVPVVNEKNCKAAFDALFKKQNPAYIAIFGADDVIPFQRLVNELYDPGNDDDKVVPSDLPYACESGYSTKISDFIDPTRVVGRIPDVPGQPNVDYVKSLIGDIIKQKEVSQDKYLDYFAVTAKVWKGSSQQSITNVFGNNTKLLECPPKGTGYTKTQLAPLSHFYNCHGAPEDPQFYGQQGSAFPVALHAKNDVSGKISYGTVAAAECCYGAELNDPDLSIASNYLLNHALAFMGSSTIAYGPADGQGLADLICQYFMKCVINGASTGRAMLEARQKFLNVSGPTLDANELKTLAQFYMLGDPSVSLVKLDAKDALSTIENRRLNLFSKGVHLGNNMAPARKVKEKPRPRHQKELKSILKDTGFESAPTQNVFEAKAPKSGINAAGAKKILGGKIRYRTFQKGSKKKDGISNIQILVVKENDDQLLGYKVYVSR